MLYMKIKLTKQDIRDLKSNAIMEYNRSDQKRRSEDDFINICWIIALERILKKYITDLDIEVENDF